MREIVETQDGTELKCGMCGFRHTTLYRFDDEEEHLAICGSCFVEALISEDDTKIADGSELVIDDAIQMLVNHALEELAAAKIDDLEGTLHAIDDLVPEEDTKQPAV